MTTVLQVPSTPSFTGSPYSSFSRFLHDSTPRSSVASYSVFSSFHFVFSRIFYSVFSRLLLLPVLQVTPTPCSPDYSYSMFSRFLLLRVFRFLLLHIFQVLPTPCSPCSFSSVFSMFLLIRVLQTSSTLRSWVSFYFVFSGFHILRVLHFPPTPCSLGFSGFLLLCVL